MDFKRQKHKVWRKNAKKLQRKRRRRLAAAKRDREFEQKQQQSPTYQIKQAHEQAQELLQLELIERMNNIEHNKWLKSEIQIEIKWREQKSRIEEHARKVEAERRRIQEEFEAEQKRIVQTVPLEIDAVASNVRDNEPSNKSSGQVCCSELFLTSEEKERLLDEQHQREIDLENRIQAYIDGVDEIPPELMVEAESNPSKEVCPIFEKTASCRFGNKCIKNHKRKKIGNILVIPTFFANICLEQSNGIMSLELEESDLYDDFMEFFSDVVPEFERFGPIEHFVVCKNKGPHLRGYVYVEYSSERNALKAQRVMQGRYYAGRMLNVDFCRIIWKTAVCDAAQKNTCRNGWNCNFFHIFTNPCEKYSVARTLRELSCLTSSRRKNSVQRFDRDDWNFNDERSKRNWRWSESPFKEIVDKNARCSEIKTHKTRHRSRDRSRSISEKRNRHHSRKHNRDRSRARSRERSRKRSREGSRSSSHRKRRKHSKNRSRSRNRSKKEKR